ncbi:hypothetical protein SAMN05445850_1766 [Paraburkholderia tuberum]|uniref:Uncharacterized protein n=1 Tax=Paraburkholderia tuberum TaxID=157910 RepID=A0A1H1DSR0_9BURK|nr:hypothetical protein SAMN05445850_1766 [Paraburkholderia tuberum]
MQIDRQTYLNANARILFGERMIDESAREWAWLALEKIRQRFPRADHWTTGAPDKNYIDIRIGAKRKGLSKGVPAIYLFVEKRYRHCRQIQNIQQKAIGWKPTLTVLQPRTHSMSGSMLLSSAWKNTLRISCQTIKVLALFQATFSKRMRM